MSSQKQTKDKKTNVPSLSSYNFKTTSYVMMKSGTRRDHDSGRLVSSNSGKKSVTT